MVTSTKRPTVSTAAGFARATTATWQTVCELDTLRVQVNNAGGRISVKDGTTHRFNWVRDEASSSVASGTGTSSGDFALNPPSGGTNAVRLLMIGVNGTANGTITVVMRDAGSSTLDMNASMTLTK